MSTLSIEALFALTNLLFDARMQLNNLREQTEEKLNMVSSLTDFPFWSSAAREPVSAASARTRLRGREDDEARAQAGQAAVADVLLEIDKQVSDLVRQQQHDSMSHGWRQQGEADEENRPVGNHEADAAGQRPAGESMKRGFRGTASGPSASRKSPPASAPPQRVSAWK